MNHVRAAEYRKANIESGEILVAIPLKNNIMYKNVKKLYGKPRPNER